MPLVSGIILKGIQILMELIPAHTTNLREII
jgi:hypothetical protein